MREIREKISASLTGGADMRGVLLKALPLALLCTIFAAPYFHHLLYLSPIQGRLPLEFGIRGFLAIQLFLLFIICLLSSLAGFSFSHRLALPGLGDWPHFKKTVPYLLVLGMVITAVSYHAFDRHFYQISQASYPTNTVYLLTYPFKAAFTDEVILRLCFVTLAVGMLKNRIAGVVLVSGVAAALSIQYFQFLGMGFQWNYLCIAQILLSFATNLVLGYLFVTRGLLYSMALNFFLGMKFIVVSWSLG